MGYLIIFVLAFAALIAFYSQPLNQNQVIKLAIKRRNIKIKKYFTFHGKTIPDIGFYKQLMKAYGDYAPAEVYLSDFPDLAAGMLKYRKHEWVIVAFEKEHWIDIFWANKGEDRSSVNVMLSPEIISNVANQYNYSTVLIFHNHPNANPQYFDCTKPSTTDIDSAKNYANVLNRAGINLLEFICERGSFYPYYMSISDSFLPVSNFIKTINSQNNTSHFKNLVLNIERILK